MYQRFINQTPTVTKNLIIINIIIFLFQTIISQLEPFLIYYGGLRSSYVFNSFAIWQFFTYMFLHGGFLHLAFNMFFLWQVGSMLEPTWGWRRFLIYYIFCGLGAGLFIFGVDMIRYSDLILGKPMTTNPTIGASGAICGLLIAYGLSFPNHIILAFFIIPMKAKYFAIGMILFSAFFLSTDTRISHSGHLGGLISGLLFFFLYRKDYVFYNGYQAMIDTWKEILVFLGFTKTSNNNLYSSNYKINKERFDPPKKTFWSRIFNRSKSSNFKLDEEKMTDSEIEERIDYLLEKISRTGLNSLNIQEQLFLDKVSKKYKHKFPNL